MNYKRLFFVIVLSMSFTSFAQSDTKNEVDKPRKNELKVNGIYFVMGAFEVSYERILNEESSVGIAAFIPYDDDVESLNYYIAPYYRHFFSKKYAKGFFVEGFGMYNSIIIDEEFYQNGVLINKDRKTKNAFGLGIGVGGKWVTKRGFLAEVNAGLGRNLVGGQDDNDVIGRIGLTLGYRF